MVMDKFTDQFTLRQNTTASDEHLKLLISQRELQVADHRMLTDPDPHLWKKIIQPSSLDLRLGKTAWIMEGSVRAKKNEKIEQLVSNYRVTGLPEINLENGAHFVQGKTYIVSLQETANIPHFAHLRSNPKSSTGRLDAQARLLTDGNPHYESVAGPYSGRMYLEIVPNSFDLILRNGEALNQVRYSVGNPIMADDEIYAVSMGLATMNRSFIYSKEGNIGKPKIDSGIVLTADLTGEHTNSNIIAYRAKKDCQQPIDFQAVGKHPLHKYFEVIEKSKHNKELKLEPGYFYLLSTNEAVCLPPAYAAELSQFDHRAGNVTWHYAGFFDPGWGYFPGEEKQGNTITLEVRVHNKAEIIRHEQPIGVMKIERLSSIPLFPYGQGRSSNYSRQIGVRYGKHFYE